MGFFDKIKEKTKELKEKAEQIKEENKNFGSTMKRINDKAHFFGPVNKEIKDGDFSNISYLNQYSESDSFLIYGSNQDDYSFTTDDIESITFVGEIPDKAPAIKIPSSTPTPPKKFMRYDFVLKNGKKFQCDVQVIEGVELDQLKVKYVNALVKKYS